MRRQAGAAVALGVIAALLPLQAATAEQDGEFTEVATPVTRPIYIGTGVDGPAPAPPTRAALRRAATEPTAEFIVDYNGFTTQQRASFQTAVDIWSRTVVSSVPIRVKATLAPLGKNVLGSAGPVTAYRQDDAFFPVALANARAGRDLDPNRPDITAQFGNDATLFYFGTDGRPPSGTYDFPSVVMHELGHGLGFLNSLDVVDGNGTYNSGASNPMPFVYDQSIALKTANGTTPVLDFPRGSRQLGDALQSDGLVWNGPSGVAAAGSGAQPKLYAPRSWESGSSAGHLDEATYPAGNDDSLMTPLSHQREVHRTPGPITLGILKDVGWTLAPTSGPTPPPSTSPSPSAKPTSEPSTTPTSSPTPAPSTSPVAPDGADGSRFTGLSPRRLLDTRDGTGAPAGRVGPGGTVDLRVVGGDVPANATAVVLNVTAVGSSRSTDIRVYPSGSSAVPTVSNLNLAAVQTRANLVTVAVGDNGSVRLRNSAGSVSLLADLAGYYAPDANSTFFPLDPTRVLDTRSNGGALAGGQTRDLPVAGRSGVPSDATAVVVSVTAVGATRSTDVRVYPAKAGGAVPEVSNINLGPGGPVPNLVIASVGDNGALRLRNSAGSTHLIVDVFGYYSPSVNGALFHPVEPSRIVDTRPARVPGGGYIDVVTAGRAGIPSGASAVALNVTGVGSAGSTDVRVYPAPRGDAAPPTVSTLNLVRGQTAADAAIVRTGEGSAVRLFNGSGSLGLTVDVAGWFGPA